MKKLKERSKERRDKGREERKKGRKEGRKEKRKTLFLFKSLFQASVCWGSQALTQTEVRKGPWHLPIKQVRTISNLWFHMPDSSKSEIFIESLILFASISSVTAFWTADVSVGWWYGGGEEYNLV